MKVKDLLEDFIDNNSCSIEVYDRSDCNNVYNFSYSTEVVKQFGYFTLKEWRVENNILKIVVQTHFKLKE